MSRADGLPGESQLYIVMEPERVQIVGAVDMPGGTVRGPVDVLLRYTDGRGREVVDVGRNGRRLICGLSVDRIERVQK